MVYLSTTNYSYASAGDSVAFIAFSVVLALIAIAIGVLFLLQEVRLKKLNEEALRLLNLSGWRRFGVDEEVNLKSAKAVENYTPIKFLQENRERFDGIANELEGRRKYETLLVGFLNNNELKGRPAYNKLEKRIINSLKGVHTYNILVKYRSPKGNSAAQKVMCIDQALINQIKSDPSVIMGKSEYNQFIKKQNQERLSQKQHECYEKVNSIIDSANFCRNNLVIKSDRDELDRLISSLFEKTANSIKKIKTPDSEEWELIENVISNIDQGVAKIVGKNQKILDYYESADFKKIQTTCESLMESQREFNEYINEKAQSISALFGSRVVRNETVNNDEYNYIRAYKKSITPFTAEVSSTVFASAENSPIEYIVKYFYPNKESYPEQIQQLQHLVEELETLKEAKRIIDDYKKEYQQYITDVPTFIMDNDENGFYSRLGFADISESVLTVEYKFSYTSDGGMAQRYFTVPMTEEVVIELINKLQSKLTMKAFAQEQRNLMTSKLRQKIKERDDYTCRFCQNSTSKEPNLLLEIDHIIPVAKGGCTVENNLQTLCWKCNRQKSSKIIEPTPTMNSSAE